MYDALAEVIGLVLPVSDGDADPVEVVHFSHPMQIEEFVGESTSGFMSSDRGNVFIASSEGYTGKGRDHLLMHELTHRFLAAQVHNYPRWLTEGLAGFYETLVVEDGKVTVGGLPQGYSQIWFGNSGFLPSLDELLKMDAETFYNRDRGRKHGNYFSAWRLVHFLTNTTSERYGRFRHYAESLVSGVPEARAWQLSFGGAGDMSDAVRLYRGTRMVGKRIVKYHPIDVPDPEIRKLSDGEVHVLWARMSKFRSFGNSKLAKKNSERRYRELREARKHEPDYAELAYWEVDLSEAEKHSALRDALWAYVESSKVPARALLSVIQLEFSSLGTKQSLDALDKLAPIVERLEGIASTGYELNSLAWYYALRKQPEKGMPFATKSVRRAPSCAECLDTYGLLLFQAKRPDLALRVQERAVMLYGEQGEVPEGVAKRLELYATTPVPEP